MPELRTLMMLAGNEVRETKPDFIIFRCKKCGAVRKVYLR